MSIVDNRLMRNVLSASETAPEAYQANLAAVAAYLLKGASSHAGAEPDLARVNQGDQIIGKRAGWRLALAALVSTIVSLAASVGPAVNTAMPLAV